MQKLSFFTAAIIMGWLSMAADSAVQIDPGPSTLKANVHATGHNFEAVAKNLKCDIRIDSETGFPTKATVSFNVLDLGTENDKRDKEMFHWLDSEHYPEISYTFDSWKSDDHKVARGHLSIHGVNLPIETPIEIDRRGERLLIDGSFEIDTTRFNLEVIKKMLFLKVDPLLKISFHIEGKVQS